MLKKILVAVDGSEGSRKAVHFAQHLSEQTGAELLLLTVIEPPTVIPIVPFEGFYYGTYDPSPENLSAAKNALEELAKALPRERVHGKVEVGSAVETVVKMAAEESVDLVVVGARGLSTGERLLLGSVSDRIVHACGCAVTVVK